jgi:hypothetical protein
MKIGDSPSRNTLTIVFSKSYNAFEGRIYFRESFCRRGHIISALPGLNWATITRVFWWAVREPPLRPAGKPATPRPAPARKSANPFCAFLPVGNESGNWPECL